MQHYFTYLIVSRIRNKIHFLLSINKNVEHKNLHQMLYQNMNKQLIISAHNDHNTTLFYIYLMVSHNSNKNSFLCINKHVEHKNLYQILFHNLNKQLIISSHNGPHATLYFTHLMVSHNSNKNSFLCINKHVEHKNLSQILFHKKKKKKKMAPMQHYILHI